MEPNDAMRAAPAASVAGAPSKRARPKLRHGSRGNAGPGNGLVRINHALEPASRAAEQWRHAQCELEQLDRAHRRRRAAIITRQQRAGAQLAAFMAKTGANRQWLTALLNLPEHAGLATEGVPDGNA